MARMFINGVDVTREVINLGEGGGGAPTFTSALIGSDTSYTGTVTFTDDIANYDLLKVVLHNVDTSIETEIITTPTMIASMYAIVNTIVWNELATNQYSVYSAPTPNTWVLTDVRNLYVKEVYGLTCDNFTVSETELYNRGSYSVSDVTISGIDLLDYDLIIFSATYDGAQVCVLPSYKGIGEDSGSTRYAIVNPYNGITTVRITNTGISAASYFIVVGVKFS